MESAVSVRSLVDTCNQFTCTSPHHCSMKQYALSTTKVMRNISEQNYTVLTEIKTNTGLQVCIMNVHVKSDV